MAKKKITPQKPAATTKETRKSLYLGPGYGHSDVNIKTDIVAVVW